MTVRGTILRIARFAVHDGPGIRTTVFLKGCPLRCPWCHSPESQHRAPELLVHPDRCIRCGRCLEVCPHGAIHEALGPFPDASCVVCGTCVANCPEGARQIVGFEAGVADVLTEIEKDRLFYDESGGGVTFSGGEPLFQATFLEALLTACRERDIATAVDTSGLAEPSAFDAIRGRTGLFLYDIKLMDEARHRKATGVSNRLILENLAALAAAGASIRLRFPLVPGINDDDANVNALGRFARSLGLHHLDLLAYHRAGIAKYARLHLAYPLPDTLEPAPGEIEHVSRLLTGYGLAVHVGG